MGAMTPIDDSWPGGHGRTGSSGSAYRNAENNSPSMFHHLGTGQDVSMIGTASGHSARGAPPVPSVDSLELATQAAQTGDLHSILRFVVVDPVVVGVSSDTLIEVGSAAQMRRIASSSF